MLEAATDAREIKTLENERRTTMGFYTVVVYIAFLVFLAVASVLYGQFIPEVLATAGETAGGELAGGQGGAAVGGLSVSSLALADDRLLMFTFLP